MTYDEEFDNAKSIIKRSRDLTKMMMTEHFIAPPPIDEDEHVNVASAQPTH
jgi:spore coat protein CotF